MTIDSSTPPPRLLGVGDGAWSVEFGTRIDAAVNRRVLGFCELLDTLSGDGRLAGVVEWLPSFRSVTVHFDPEVAAPMALRQLLASLAGESGSVAARGCRWHLPVCFDADCAPDLDEVAALTGMTPAQVVELLTGTVFTVCMLGFLPGFAYLGGLPAALEVPRLATPRQRVPARSIAVAGGSCAAYPWESPGGWRLLGRTPIRLFDADNARRPALLAPGDEVCWQAIDRAGYERLDADCASGRFDPSRLRRAGPGPAPESVQGRNPTCEPLRGKPESLPIPDRGEGSPASALVEVVAGGLAVSIQDAGRSGYRKLGVPVSGVLDPTLMAAANALVGNPGDAAVLEIGFAGPTLRAVSGSVRVGLAGAVAGELINSRGQRRRVEPWQTATLFPGDEIRVGTVAAGIACLAISGGFQVPLQLGSRSTYRRAGLGGVGGREPAGGDRLPCVPFCGDLWLEHRGRAPWQHEPGPIRVILGPQDDHFDAAVLAEFLTRPYRVGRDLDRMGMRLDGPRLQHNAKGAEIVSDGVAVGAVQVPGNGQPIVLLADCQTTGGYPKIATVIGADLPRLAHLRPGDELRFAAVDHAAALAARRQSRQRLAAWIDSIESFRPPGGIDEAALYAGNLVSGAVRGDEAALSCDDHASAAGDRHV